MRIPGKSTTVAIDARQGSRETAHVLGGSMSVLVTGSVAIDHIMVFPDRFENHILPDQIHILNVAFAVPTLERRWGGTGANIAFNLRRLEEDPLVLATVGSDFGDYAKWMDAHGIRRDLLGVLDDALTAQRHVHIA